MQCSLEIKMNRKKQLRGGLHRYATGGDIVGVNKRNTMIPAPQSQKVPEKDARGEVGSKEWYENYGSGPEHLFLGDRTLPTVGPFAQQSGLPPPPNTQQGSSLGDYIPLLGMGAVVGKDLWDWYKNREGASISPELAKQIESGAMDTSATNEWIMNDLTSRGERMPMPFMYEDGTVGYIGGDENFWTNKNQFWDDMDAAAMDTSNIDAWNQQQLDEYGKNMEMPTLDIDPTLMQRLGQGAGGAFDLYAGSQQGGLEGAANMISGAGDLYGSVAGNNAFSSGAGRVGGGLAGVADVYSGIQQGGVKGYTQAASGALQTANSLGYNTGAGALGMAGKAIPLVGAAISAYGAYESAKVGDKKGAVSQGAAAGAAIGSVVPVIGTAVGAVIGAAVGLIGASLGDKQQASEMAYGAHKKLDPKESIRGWSEDQVGGAVFETIKSHTKSGNINKFKDVAEMYTAMGITKDAHKNYKTVQSKMDEFIKGTIETAIGMGALPNDPTALRQLDGQQFFYKVVTPALAEKFKETTGQESTGWNVDRSGGDSMMHNLFADWTDYIFANWGKEKPKNTVQPVIGGGGGGGRRVLEKRQGGLARFNEGGMVPQRGGGLSMATAPRRPSIDDPSSYYRYGANSSQQRSPMQGSVPQPPQPPQERPPMPQTRQPGQVPARPLPPMMQKAMGGLSAAFSSGGPRRLVRGPGTGRSDDIPAVLSDGEYVMDAETVALLGDGSTDEGARRLDELRKKLRMHKGKQLSRGQFSSAAKNPEEYL
jgi:hypothetical protein